MPNLTNLLPSDRVRALSGEYVLRVLTLLAGTVVVLALIHAALLLPSYVYLSEEVQTRTEHLADFSAALGSSEERLLSERSAAIEADAQALLQVAGLARTAPVLEELLKVAHPGVRITGFSLSPSLEGGEAKMSVTGVAVARDSLRRYYQSLSSLSFVSSADLPLSVYAAEAEIPFTIQLTGTLP